MQSRRPVKPTRKRIRNQWAMWSTSMYKYVSFSFCHWKGNKERRKKVFDLFFLLEEKMKIYNTYTQASYM